MPKPNRDRQQSFRSGSTLFAGALLPLVSVLSSGQGISWQSGIAKISVEGNTPAAGFVVKVQGRTAYLVTCAHVVQPTDRLAEVEFQAAPGKTYSGKAKSPQYSSRDRGLTVVEVGDADLPPNLRVIPLVAAAKPKIGDPVAVAGFPKGARNGIFTVVEGTIATIDGLDIAITHETPPGFSGGPVLRGNSAIGVVWGNDDTAKLGLVEISDVVKHYVDAVLGASSPARVPIANPPRTGAVYHIRNSFADRTQVGYAKGGNLGIVIYTEVSGIPGGDLDPFYLQVDGRAASVVLLIDGSTTSLNAVDPDGRHFQISRSLLETIMSASIVEVRFSASRLITLTTQDQSRLKNLLEQTSKGGFTGLMSDVLKAEAQRRQKRKEEIDTAPEKLAGAKADLLDAWSQIPKIVQDAGYKTEISYDLTWAKGLVCQLHFVGSEKKVSKFTGDEINTIETDVRGTPIAATIESVIGPAGDLKFHSSLNGDWARDAHGFQLNDQIDKALLVRIRDDFQQIAAACKLLYP